MKNYFKKYNKGYSLIEIIFYISIFVVLSLVVIDALVVMTKAFRENNIQSDIVSSSSIMERISREIKQANTATVNTSSDLTLMVPNQVDALVRPVRFVLSGGNIELYDNSVLIDNLNSNDVTVVDLTFSGVLSSYSAAVRINLSVSSVHDPLGRVYDFQNTVVLRGSY